MSPIGCGWRPVNDLGGQLGGSADSASGAVVGDDAGGGVMTEERTVPSTSPMRFHRRSSSSSTICKGDGDASQRASEGELGCGTHDIELARLDRCQVHDLEIFGFGETTKEGEYFGQALDALVCLQAHGLIVG